MRCLRFFHLALAVLLLSVWGVLCLGCVSTKTTAAPKAGMDQVVGREWILNAVKGNPVPSSVRALIRFASDGKITGEGGCNGFFGSYTYSEGKLAIGPLGSTKMMCPPEVMEVEDPFLATLSGTLDVAIDGDTLTLCAEGKENCLVFTAQ